MAAEVQSLSTSALWYAWGRIDSGTLPGLTTEHGMEFQKEYTLIAEAYAAEKLTFRPNVIDAFQAFAARITAEFNLDIEPDTFSYIQYRDTLVKATAALSTNKDTK